MNPIVIIGSGIAGYTLARELRKHDKAQPVILVTRDDGCSYYKPKLSSAYTDGKTPDELVMARPAQLAEQLQIDIRPHTVVTAINPAAHEVHVDGEIIVYGKLVLAIGADPIRVPVAGDAAERILSINDRADYARFRAAAVTARHVLIMGAGLIGCEFANDLASAGIASSVVDPAAAPLGRLLPAQAAAALRGALAEAGVDWRFGVTVQQVDSAADRLTATLSDGSIIETDVVLSAIGLRPRLELAQAAGLACGRGIQVGRQLKTSAEDIYALGDCAEVAGLVLPFVAPILQGARALGATLAGTPTAVDYPAMPVLVKTSRHPVIVCPPPAGVNGEWAETVDTGGVCALFHDESGKLRGFALTGTTVGDKNTLAQQIPPLLA